MTIESGPRVIDGQFQSPVRGVPPGGRLHGRHGEHAERLRCPLTTPGRDSRKDETMNARKMDAAGTRNSMTRLAGDVEPGLRASGFALVPPASAPTGAGVAAVLVLAWPLVLGGGCRSREKAAGEMAGDGDGVGRVSTSEKLEMTLGAADRFIAGLNNVRTEGRLALGTAQVADSLDKARRFSRDIANMLRHGGSTDLGAVDRARDTLGTLKKLIAELGEVTD